MSVKVVKEKRCKSQYTRVRVKENLDKNGNCVEMLMRKGWRESKPLGGKWKVPTEAWGNRKQGAVMGEVEGGEEREMRTERLQRISETSELY